MCHNVGAMRKRTYGKAKKTRNNAQLHARCPDDLNLQVDIVANMLRLDRSDIIRMACRELVARYHPPAPIQIQIQPADSQKQ